MTVDFSGKLVVAISSRALFDLDESHAIYENEGIEAYRNFQRKHEEKVLEPGAAFNLVQKFLALNKGLPPRKRFSRGIAPFTEYGRYWAACV